MRPNAGSLRRHYHGPERFATDQHGILQARRRYTHGESRATDISRDRRNSSTVGNMRKLAALAEQILYREIVLDRKPKEEVICTE